MRRWAPIGGTLAIGIIYLLLPAHLQIIPGWIPLALEIILLSPLVFSSVTRRALHHIAVRVITLIILGLVTALLASGVALLVITLPGNTHAETLLQSAALLWATNVLVFSLWYWEIDGGGPLKRHLSGHKATDLMFPQQVDGNTSGWVPLFLDYLFVAFTGATALSPTDTYPLTRRAKVLMMIEALISVAIIILLVGRAVNILS
jgi:hypothetical protein